MATIRRNEALKVLDIKEDKDGNQKRFSIIFDKKNGERVFYKRAVSCGLNMNLKENRYRGVVAVDANGDKIGHPTPVGIDRIIELNGEKITM